MTLQGFLNVYGNTTEIWAFLECPDFISYFSFCHKVATDDPYRIFKRLPGTWQPEQNNS